MSCPVCGKPYPCVHGRGLQTASGVEVADRGQEPAIASPGSPVAVEARGRAGGDQWRQEVVLRVRQHRARRGRFDSNASLELDFPSETALAVASALASPAGEQLVESAIDLGETNDQGGNSEAAIAGPAVAAAPPQPRKIIRFPRYPRVEPVIVARPPLEELELAEPAPEAPRILDAPEPEAEQMDLLPSFADIRLEEAPSVNDLCEELESAPHPASFGRRMASGIVDIGIVLFACGLFAATFVQIVAGLPSGRAGTLFGLAVAATLWLLFQYLFLVCGAATPGMRATRLALFSFKGKRASRFARGLRVLATALSAFSVGLGFAWAFVDEDTLGWHDRISQTYLKRSN